ncbi:MAG: DJ-1/PfpI family protein [Lentilactobacillus hilgardii]|uniref:DJ-1/PfpI family protein n=1 Tax=Lentilactobacillus hilgardii TaxID=1588 RepID=UPI001CC20998|nr:DJ-1/PfpI family protein [Lentilactobacillus hilgardii]MBZ2199813.1 DJ-1 family protein [Lentilactobacillus hilgardii]MBZ2203693.1 DJ-1 family protein [Lentilactobacillus hilgardii]
MTNVLLFLNKGFETMEFSPFMDVCGWARNDYVVDINVTTAGFKPVVSSTFNVDVMVDKVIDEININDFDALAIPGGFEEYGFYQEAYSDGFLNLIRQFHDADKLIATICVGALPVGKSGILKGKNATTYHLKDSYRQTELKTFGANIVNEPIVFDDNVITSYCPQTAAHVAFKMLGILINKETEQTVKHAMGY